MYPGEVVSWVIESTEMDAADLVRKESDESIGGGDGERRLRADLPHAGLTTGETAGGSTLVGWLG